MRSALSHLRFTIRTLFIFVLACGGLLGWFSCQVRAGQQKQRIIDRLRASGGLVSDSDYYPKLSQCWGWTPKRPGTAWFRALAGEDACIEFDQLELRGLEVTEDVVADIAWISTIKRLSFYKCQFTDLGMDTLPTLHGLDSLEFEECNLHPADAARIGRCMPRCDVKFDGTSTRIDDPRFVAIRAAREGL